jgi:hypothetical protein
MFLKSPCGKGRASGRPILRRDEGVDEHPQAKNNAKIGVRGPECRKLCPRSGTNAKPQNVPLLHRLLRTSLALQPEFQLLKARCVDFSQLADLRQKFPTQFHSQQFPSQSSVFA